MDIFVFLGIVLSLLILYFLWKTFPFRHIPGPSIRQYLPGGIVFPMLVDPGKSADVIVNIREKYGDLCYFWVGPRLTVFTSNPTDVAHIFNSTDVFIRPVAFRVVFKDFVPSGLLEKSGEDHRNARRRLTQHFTPSMVRGFHENILYAAEEVCQSLSDHSKNNSKHVDITQELATVTIRIMTNVAFGFSLTSVERREFSNLITDMVEEMMAEFLIYPCRQWMEPFGVRKKFHTTKKELQKRCLPFIEGRMKESAEQKNARQPDVLDAILAISDGDMRQVLSHVIEFVMAGSHTTSITLAWALYELCCNPQVAAKLDNELKEQLGTRQYTESVTREELEKMSYVRKVWKETNRVHPAGPFLMRKAGQKTVLKGSRFTLPAGTQVIVSPMVQHTLPDVWKNPYEFRPERWDTGAKDSDTDRVTPGVYIPFSMGPRGCAGRFLADYEGAILLTELFRRFEFELACKPSEVVSRTAWAQSGRYSSKGDGNFDMGIPMNVKLR